MFSAKTLLKANFLAARARVATMTEEAIMWEESAPPYEASHDLLFVRECRRKARAIWAKRDADWLDVVHPTDADEPQEVTDWLAGLDLGNVLAE